MRKFILIVTILAIFLLILPSCGAAGISAEEIREVLEADFAAAMQISYRDLEIEATLTSPKIGGEIFEIHAPPSLNGLAVNFSGETPTLTHLGLTAELTSTDIPLTSAITAIINTLNAAKSNEITISQSGTTITVSGRSLSGNFTLTFNEDLILETINIRQINLTATITQIN